MPEPIVRLATSHDAAAVIELLVTNLGTDYPAKEVYDPAWMAAQLEAATGQETWVAEANGVIQASLSILRPGEWNNNPVLNLGRNLFRPAALVDGSAKALLQKIDELASERGQTVVLRVSASDSHQQVLFENNGYVCVGFQPFKHMLQTRAGMLFYVKQSRQVLTTRLPMSESLSQISELATLAFDGLGISNPLSVRDGATGYPLQSDVKIHEASMDDYQSWRTHVETLNPPVEISGTFNLGFGFMRIPSAALPHTLLAQREQTIVAGLAFTFDEHDRCVRIIDGFSTDDLSMGALMQHATKLAQEVYSAVYVEMDILATATRLLKVAEQLGYVPVGYLPGFYSKADHVADVVKFVKLNMPYSLDAVDLTTHSRKVVEVVDRNFEDQRVGVAIINLLRALPIFIGLGDGELRKMARLFTQKLYRPGEQIFKKGDSGEEAFIVMRGQIDILLEEDSKPIATIQSGKIFGELAFLDGAPRNAFATASQASILLVVQRLAFNDLVQREPHLGMVVMKNIALDLSNKLRAASATIASLKKDA
ncbi:MAG: cyclic nucleotide-binding domain-containing protein [Limisphaerales bacterium]